MPIGTILNASTITVDDTYKLRPSPGNAVNLSLSGDFGGGTLTPGYINRAGTFIGFKDESEATITFTAAFQIVQDCGIGCPLAVLLVGSTTPAIVVDQFAIGR